MIIEQLEVGSMRNFAYVLGDEAGGQGLIIDPPRDLAPLDALLTKHRLHLELVLNTHSHFDHIGGNAALRARGAKLAAHRLADTRPDIALSGGERLRLGALTVQVLHTPGHAADAVCFIAEPYLFTGDTLFVGECGRVDLDGSDARAMHHSLLTVLRSLPDSLMVMPGHNYGPVPSRSLGEEKRENHTLAPRSLSEFLKFMAEP